MDKIKKILTLIIYLDDLPFNYIDMYMDKSRLINIYICTMYIDTYTHAWDRYTLMHTYV